jgi:hypothetical protein
MRKAKAMKKRYIQELHLPQGPSTSGITIKYHPDKKMIEISGWHRDVFETRGGEISLGDFLRELGITRSDVSEQKLEGDE